MPQVCVSVRSGSVAVNWPVALLAVPPSSCTDATIGPPLIAGALLVAATVTVTGWVTGPPLWSSTIFGVSGVFVVSVGATVGLISETGSVLVWFSGSGVLVWFVLVGILVGPVLAGGVLSGVVVVNVIFVGELSIGELLVGAELGPLEPPGAGELPGPDGVSGGAFRFRFGPVGPVGAVPMAAAVAAAIAWSDWNDCPSIACTAGGFTDSDIIPAGDTENMLLTLLTLTALPVIRMVKVNAPANCSPAVRLVSNPSDATVWPSTDDTSTVTKVPRIPNVAVGVSTRMLPVLATWEAMKLTVPWTRLINAEFDVLFGS